MCTVQLCSCTASLSCPLWQPRPPPPLTRYYIFKLLGQINLSLLLWTTSLPIHPLSLSLAGRNIGHVRSKIYSLSGLIKKKLYPSSARELQLSGFQGSRIRHERGHRRSPDDWSFLKARVGLRGSSGSRRPPHMQGHLVIMLWITARRTFPL